KSRLIAIGGAATLHSPDRVPRGCAPSPRNEGISRERPEARVARTLVQRPPAPRPVRPGGAATPTAAMAAGGHIRWDIDTEVSRCARQDACFPATTPE